MAGVDEAMVLSEQLGARVFGNGAEPVVDVGDSALRIRDGDDGVLIERRLQLGEFRFGSVVCGPLHNFVWRSRSALAMTDTELRLMAAPARMGLSRTVNSG